MSKLICPFCGDELAMDYTGVMYCCNQNCGKSADWYGSKILWQELIRTRKALEIAKDALNKIDKQLMTGIEMTCQARNALEQITAEQKDVK